MKKYTFLLSCVLVSFLLFNNTLYAQTQKKPKVALVLSGGGAKGIAHVPLLQKLDSLNIVPDLIIGTSMGSIVGGLYAMGYSGDSIAVMVETIDWGMVFRDKISLRDVSLEEKSEFDKYLTELDFVEGKPKVRTELLNDQGIRELFSYLTYPVYDVDDFDDLAIPFRAIAVDIVNGNEVVLEDGHLKDAMRASMAIPGVFSPMEYKDVLLVDGGVLNNFPVDVAKELGADIVIGSDVGGGMVGKEKLGNLTNLLFQTGMLNSNLKNPGNRALCDVLLKHKTKESFSSADFGKSAAIYETGKAAVIENMQQLIDLSEQLKPYEQRTYELPVVSKKIKIDELIINNISEGNQELIEARSNFKEGEEYEVAEIVKGVHKAMGTTLFNTINFDLHPEGEKNVLTITGKEHGRHRLKASLHYDEYRGVGLIFNYTGRNIIGEGSKLLLTVDVAEQPKIRLLHHIHFGKMKHHWWQTEFFAENMRQDLFKNGESVDNVKHRFYNANTHFNINTNSLNSGIGLGLAYQHTKLFPSVNPDLSDNFLNLRSYYFNHLELFLHYTFDDMDSQHFGRNGSRIYARVGQSLLSDVKAQYSTGFLPNVDASTNAFTKFSVESEHRISLGKKSTAVIGANLGFIFENEAAQDDVSFKFYGIAGQYALGGYIDNARIASFKFDGLHEDELIVTQFMNLDLGVQWNLVNKFYVKPHFDIASVGFGDFDDYIENAFNPKGDWQDTFEDSLLMSAGALFEYNSILGPVKLDFSWVNKIQKVRVFFGVGFYF